MSVRITSASVVTGRGADSVFLITNKPDPEYPYTGYLTFRFNAAKGSGADYVKRVFELDAEVISIPQSTHRFSDT